MSKKRDHYRYTLSKDHKIVYIGETEDTERREEEHRDDGKKFTSMNIKGPAVKEESAEKWEQQKLESYRRSHHGKNPRYNKED